MKSENITQPLTHCKTGNYYAITSENKSKKDLKEDKFSIKFENKSEKDFKEDIFSSVWELHACHNDTGFTDTLLP